VWNPNNVLKLLCYYRRNIRYNTVVVEWCAHTHTHTHTQVHIHCRMNRTCVSLATDSSCVCTSLSCYVCLYLAGILWLQSHSLLLRDAYLWSCELYWEGNSCRLRLCLSHYEIRICDFSIRVVTDCSVEYFWNLTTYPPAIMSTSRESPCMVAPIKRPKCLKYHRTSVMMDVTSCYLFALHQGFGGNTASYERK
jgi:hypothetical protein